jgi:flagellar hook assembly protein FlgD
VKLEIFNIMGQKVATLVDQHQDAGSYTVRWNSRGSDGNRVSSGIYLYRLSAGDFVETKKMILMK